MTRREEIEKAAKQRYPYEGGTKGMICENSIPIFIQGAEWADKTMIEKACSILEDMTEGRLGKRFISEFKNKLKYGVLERH